MLTALVYGPTQRHHTVIICAMVPQPTLLVKGALHMKYDGTSLRKLAAAFVKQCRGAQAIVVLVRGQ
jgi:hypothetical protein